VNQGTGGDRDAQAVTVGAAVGAVAGTAILVLVVALLLKNRKSKGILGSSPSNEIGDDDFDLNTPQVSNLLPF
jgi:hypothetical protein